MLESNRPVYLLKLPFFDPYLGVDTSNHNKHPFYCYEDHSIFERDERKIHSGEFRFETIVTEDKVNLYVSEPNLLAMFKKSYFTKTIIRDHGPIISIPEVTEMLSIFKQGYGDGYKNFESEINESLLFLNDKNKKQAIARFIDFCHYHLFFEGFATPGCLYALGYIQANLVRATSLYRNLSLIEIKTSDKPTLAIKNTNIDLAVTEERTTVKNSDKIANPVREEIKPEASETNSDNFPRKIIIKYPSKEISELWMILLECHKFKTFKTPAIYTRKEQILSLLGMMFNDQSDDKVITNTPHVFQPDFSIHHQKILNLLMHATFKLNGNRWTINLAEYASMLKNTFSCYQKSSVASISSNMHKKIAETIAAIMKLEKSNHKNNTLKTLRKIGDYRVHMR